MDDSSATDSALLARAVFFSNIFQGSFTLSSFELVRGNRPSILGSQRRILTEELIELHKNSEYKRALQRMVKARQPNITNSSSLTHDTKMFYFYKSSKQNEPVGWRKGTVVRALDFFVEILTEKNRKTNVAYEDIHVRPQNNLTLKPMEGCVKDFICNETSMQATDSTNRLDDDVMVTTAQRVLSQEKISCRRGFPAKPNAKGYWSNIGSRFIDAKYRRILSRKL